MKSCVLFLALLSSFAHAQNSLYPALSKIVQVTRKQSQVLPKADQKIDQKFQLIHAETASVNGDEVLAQGTVQATYKGYRIFAETLKGNRRSQVFELIGGAKLIGETETIEGDSIRIDFSNDSFLFSKASSTIKPDRLQGQVTGDLYVRSDEGFGNKNDFSTFQGSMTTCDLTHAHYELNYRKSRTFVGKRLELRDVRFEILGRTLLRLPMLNIPLNRNAPKYLPEVGQSVDEGYYVKSKITSALPGESFLDTHIDLMSKLGAGLGLDYNYINQGAVGKLTSYLVTGGDKTKILTANLQQKFGSSTLNLNSVYQMSDYLSSPGATNWNSSANFLVPRKGGQMRLGFNQSSSNQFGFSTSNQVVSFGDSGILFGTRGRLDVSYSKSRNSGFSTTTQNESVDLRFGSTAEARSFTADLLYQRNVPIGQQTGFYGTSDVTPLLTLKSNLQRLTNSKFSKVWPLDFEASIGELVNPSAVSNPRVTRIHFNAGIQRHEKISKRLTVDWDSKFRQGLYSDDTAQYVLGHDANLRYEFAKESHFGMTYTYLRAFGFTPLSIDSTGRYDSFSFDLSSQPSKALTLTAQSGYDVFQGSNGEVPWQFLWLRSRYNPSNRLDLGLSAAYDTFNHAWSNIRLDSKFEIAHSRMTAAARYDGIRSQWAGLNLLVEGFKVGKVTTNAIFDYNGYSKQFDTQHYQFIYDLHCMEAILEIMDNQTGFRDGRTIGFYVRIKALPSGSGFGQGTRGNSIGSGALGFGN